jgi:hypothetical protein
MVLRETTKGKWKEVQVDEQRPVAYFGDRFLKPSKKKSDPTPIFNAGPPQMFGLVFRKDVWDNIQAQEDKEVRKITLHIIDFSDMDLIGIRPISHWQSTRAFQYSRYRDIQVCSGDSEAQNGHLNVNRL